MMRNFSLVAWHTLHTELCPGVFLALDTASKPVRLCLQCALLFFVFVHPFRTTYAASLNYTGDASQLQNTPVWVRYPHTNVLFPGSTADPSSSGNDITTDFASGTSPGGIVGGLSKNENAEDNTVTVKNGVIGGVIIGGYVDAGTGSANGNQVIIKENGKINGSISGGMVDAGTGTANNNTLTIQAGAAVQNGITGGQASAGEARGNTVNVEGAALGQSVWGGTSASGDASQNKINITESTVFAEIYGGSSSTGNASKNEVQIKDTIITSDHNIGVHGGLATQGNALENSVRLQGTTVAKDVSGGKSMQGSAIGNAVFISDTAKATSLSGGAVLEGSGEARGNAVTMTGGTVTGNISGGRVMQLSDGVFVPTGGAVANTLNISGGTVVSAAFGGQSSLGHAINNQVTISGTAQLKNNLFGGYSLGADAASNTVTVKGGEVSSYVYGGRSDAGNTQGNTVVLEGGKVGGIFGAYTPQGYATDNRVIITGGAVTGSVYGARSVTSSASNNSVVMKEGTAATLYGAYSDAGKTDNNSVAITSGTVTANIYGGQTAAGATANNNTVTIGSAATVGSSAASLVYGGYTAGGAAENNSVTIDGGKVLGATYGAYGKTQVNTNTVNSIGGNVHTLFGGYSSNGDAITNSVNMKGGTAAGNIFGGFAANGDANSNSVHMQGSTIAGGIFGGYSPNGDASNNSVNIKGGTVAGNIFGGYAHTQSDAINNTVTISGAAQLSSATLVGGFQGAGTGDVFTGNTLNIDGFKGSVQGLVNFENINFTLSAPLQSGDTVLKVLGSGITAISNSHIGIAFSDNPLALQVGTHAALIDATAGTLLGSINETKTFGATGAKGLWTYTLSTANNQLSLFANKLEINDLDAGPTYAVTAGSGLGQWAALKVNKEFSVKDFTIASSSTNTAGLAVGGAMAVENFTAINNTGPLSVNVNTLDVTQQNTTLTLEGTSPWNGTTGVLFGNIALGGEKTLTLAGSGNFDFNQLDVHGKNVTWDGDLNGAGKKISFFLTPNVGKNDTLLTITGTAVTSITGCSITTHVSGGAPVLGAGDRIQLIHAKESVLSGAPSSITGSQGISLLYEFEFLQDEHHLYGTVSRMMLNPQTKALSEGRVLGLAFINEGVTLLAEEGMRALRNAAKPHAGSDSTSRVVTFATTGVHQSRFATGSYIDEKGVSLVTGLAWDMPLPANSLLLGTFFETGKGAYTSCNTFSNAANVKASGDTVYYGAGLLGRYEVTEGLLTNLYTEVSLRAGHTRTDFSSNDLRDAAGRYASYTSGSAYYGTHAGLGYIWQVSEKGSIDFSTKYLWTHQAGDSVTVTGDPIQFKASDSQRWRNGVRFTYAATKQISPYIGAAWEEEYDGTASATTYGHAIEAPSLRGSTTMSELGADFYTEEKSNFTLSLGIQKYTGKRESVSGNVSLKYEY